jgi:Cysteine-rich secretory protein family
MAKPHHHLKHYFVPHDGNDHIPHALKPKRLIFHVSGAILVKVIVFLFISAFPLRAWLAPDVAAQESKNIITMTNNLRAGLKLSPLAENSKLDQAAAQKVSDMLLNQYFAHVSPSGVSLETFIKKVGYGYAMAGENLAMGFNTAPEVMAAWENSPTHYANLTDPNFQDIGVAMDVGRYENADTAFAAQYFGRPAQELAAAVTEPVKKIVLPPKETTLTIKTPVASADRVLNVAVKLPDNTAAATAVVNNVKIDLTQSGQNNWQGVVLVGKDDVKAMTNPVVPASVDITDTNGNKALAALDWNDVQSATVSPYDQYLLFKQNPAPGMRAVLRISDIYFWLLFALIGGAFVTFIVMRKKHHHHIFWTSLGAAMVMMLLIIV